MTITHTAPTAATFLRDHLAPSRPLIVRGSADDRDRIASWTFSGLAQQLGALRVPLYNTLFDLVGLSTFGEYCDRYLGDTTATVAPYLRWFAKQSHQRLPWSDDAFDILAQTWRTPSWIPTHGYVFPNYPDPVDLTRTAFPAKGIFVCPRGGMTSWHIDPWHSDAILCQMIGRKRLVIYAPGTPMPADPVGLASVLEEPQQLPDGWPARRLVDVILEPGDCAFIPQNHPHAAVALADSLSLTWNFVHQAADLAFTHLAETGSHDPVLQYFTSQTAPRPTPATENPSLPSAPVAANCPDELLVLLS